MKRFIYCMLWLLAVHTGCKKEEQLQPSGDEKNYLVVSDSSSDTVDHARYLFYQATGLPVFYNDTIARREVGNIAGVAQYFYHRLAVAYSPAGRDIRLTYKLLTQKEKVLPMLPMLQEYLLPRIPAGIPLHSILIVESMRMRGNGNESAASTNLPYIGFNTVLLKSIDPDMMTEEDRDHYIATVLAMLALKKLVSEYPSKLTTDFYSISNKNAPAGQAYGQHISVLSPDNSLTLQDFGFISSHPNDVETAPVRQDDLQVFLEAVFFYNRVADFEDQYVNYPLILNKFRIVRNMAKQIGFQLTD